MCNKTFYPSLAAEIRPTGCVHENRSTNTGNLSFVEADQAISLGISLYGAIG
jgi:hypothetical protein